MIAKESVPSEILEAELEAVAAERDEALADRDRLVASIEEIRDYLDSRNLYSRKIYGSDIRDIIEKGVEEDNE